MTGYVVSKGGTFGVPVRRYRNEDGESLVVIRWGRFITPVFERDVKYLESSYEGEARKEAEEWLVR